MAVKGGYLIIASGGAILVWSGLKGKSWSTVLRTLIKGGKPQDIALTAYPIAGNPASANPETTVPSTGSNGPVGGTVAKNKAIGRVLAAGYGWSTGAQWNALDALWTRESGWDNRAKNPTSGAYGIAQALGHGPTNQYPAGPANPPISSASAQIAWGLAYIKQTYGNPIAAEAHENSAGWY
jgi:hypothetical protein